MCRRCCGTAAEARLMSSLLRFFHMNCSHESEMHSAVSIQMHAFQIPNNVRSLNLKTHGQAVNLKFAHLINTDIICFFFWFVLVLSSTLQYTGINVMLILYQKKNQKSKFSLLNRTATVIMFCVCVGFCFVFFYLDQNSIRFHSIRFTRIITKMSIKYKLHLSKIENKFKLRKML